MEGVSAPVICHDLECAYQGQQAWVKLRVSFLEFENGDMNPLRLSSGQVFWSLQGFGGSFCSCVFPLACIRSGEESCVTCVCPHGGGEGGTGSVELPRCAFSSS